MGDAGERPSGPWVADAAGEKASLYAASCQLQAVPHNGDQPQGISHHSLDLSFRLGLIHCQFSLVPVFHAAVFYHQVPVNLLRAGRIFVFEPPPGVKANMLRTFSSIPVARMCKVT